MTILQFRKEVRVSLDEFVESWVKQSKAADVGIYPLEMDTFEDWIEEFLKWEDIDPHDLKTVATT